jgi:hypothetical protein
MDVDWGAAAPTLATTVTMVSVLGFERGLYEAAKTHYAGGIGKSRPHMIRNFAEWWIDLIALVGAGVGASASALLSDRPSERASLFVVAIVFWSAAVLAAVRFNLFEYRTRFRLLRWILNHYNATRVGKKWTLTLWAPKTSPAFPLIMAGNLVGFMQTVTV